MLRASVDDAHNSPQKDTRSLIMEHQDNTDTGEEVGIMPVGTPLMLDKRIQKLRKFFSSFDSHPHPCVRNSPGQGNKIRDSL